MIPLIDASRRPVRFPTVTLTIVVGDAFVQKWATIPADISAGRDLIAVVTEMLMHASWAAHSFERRVRIPDS
jgi:hypothetical protein